MENPDIVAIIQEQVDAHNARDIERFLACYALEATILDGNSTVLWSGHEAIRAVHGQLFAQSPSLHVDIPTRILVSSWVVDEEICTGYIAESMPPEIHAVVVYQMANSKI